ncbi:MAG: carboxypeptidase regulatory-like domain-containing protein [Ignavibacteria bacterium]|nr:carboxypeptidase regulatory-like domain-containing protein [Ignavibacteria bacterium]
MTSTDVVQQGNIIGRVYLGSDIPPQNESNQSITVTLTGNTSYSAVSADSGKFAFEKVVQGIYTVTYSKTGYVSYSLKNVQFVGNGTLELRTIYLQQEEVSPVTQKSTFGYIRLFDENGDSLSNHGGATVSIVGTSVSVISDLTGAFYFHKYPSGKFDVSFSKSGYQTFVVPNVVFPDSNLISTKQLLDYQGYNTVALANPPKFEIQLDTVLFNTTSDDNRYYYELVKQQDGSNDTIIRLNPRGKILPTGYGKQISVVSVFGDTPDVSVDSYDPTISPQIVYSPLDNPSRSIYHPGGYSYFIAPDSRWHILRAGKVAYLKIYAQWTFKDKSLHYFENRAQKRLGMSGYSTKVIKFTFPTTYKFD